MSLKKSLTAIATKGLRVVNTTVFLMMAAFCVYLLFHLEFSQRVRGEADIQLADAKQLFAPADGRLVPSCQDGQDITRGSLVARIVNDDLVLKEISVKGQLDDVNLRLKGLQFATDTSLVEGEIEFWKKRKVSFERNLEEIRQRQIAQEVRAPVDGKVVGTRRRSVAPTQAAQDLSITENTPFDPQNIGCHVKRGDSLCYVADSSKYSGFLNVSEKDIELVEVGQPVRVFVPHSSSFVNAEVVKVTLESQQGLSNAGGRPTKSELPTCSYLVEIQFDSNPQILVGSRKTAVIVCNKTTSVGWLKRWWRHPIGF